MRENADQNNSEYGHLLRSVCVFEKKLWIWNGHGDLEMNL